MLNCRHIEFNIKKIYRHVTRYRFVAGFLLIGNLCVLDYISYKMETHSSIFISIVKKHQLTKVVEQSQNFYKIYSQPLQTDEFVMLTWLWPERALGFKRVFSDDPFDRLYKDGWKKDDVQIIRKVDTVDEMNAFFDIFGKGEYLYDVGDKYKQVLISDIDDVMMRALYCDKAEWGDFDNYLLKRIKDNVGGYGDTHYLLGLLFLEKLNCVNGEFIEKEKQSVIEQIVGAQKNDNTFSDLFVERIVFLYWAGAGDKVEYSWIKVIVNNVQDDGGWKDVSANITDAHTTGLSVLAIKYFIEGENLQNVLIKNDIQLTKH